MGYWGQCATRLACEKSAFSVWFTSDQKTNKRYGNYGKILFKYCLLLTDMAGSEQAG